MAYAYEDTHMGTEMDAKQHPDTQLAGEVIDIGSAMSNMQQSNAITRSLDRNNQQSKPPATIIPLPKVKS